MLSIYFLFFYLELNPLFISGILYKLFSNTVLLSQKFERNDFFIAEKYGRQAEDPVDEEW